MYIIFCKMLHKCVIRTSRSSNQITKFNINFLFQPKKYETEIQSESNTVETLEQHCELYSHDYQQQHSSTTSSTKRHLYWKPFKCKEKYIHRKSFSNASKWYRIGELSNGINHSIKHTLCVCVCVVPICDSYLKYLCHESFSK